jgi:meiotically up-regulated gene 157 (Mug157) protein
VVGLTVVSSTIYQLFIPANMMFSRYLDSASEIMATIGGQRNLANHMHNFSQSIRRAVTQHGIVNDPTYGQVYAFEVDGFGSGIALTSFPCELGVRD